MKMIKKINLLIHLFIFFSSLIGQNSFQIAADDNWFSPSDLVVNENNELGLFTLDPFTAVSTNFYFTEVPKGGGISAGFRFSIPYYQPFYHFNSYQNSRFISLGWNWGFPGAPSSGASIIFSFEKNTNHAWARTKMYLSPYGGYSLDNNENILLGVTREWGFIDSLPYDKPNISELFSLAPDGSTIWKKGLKLIHPTFPTFPVLTFNLASHVGSTTIIHGNFALPLTAPESHDVFIIQVDNNGEPLQWKTIREHHLNQILTLPNGEIYLFGKTKTPFPFTNNKENAIIVKLDSNFNLVWSKVFHAENFEFNKLSLQAFENGNLVLAYATRWTFPVIFAKISPNGDIIWEKGFPFYFPEVDVMPNGSLLMLTKGHFDDLGNITKKGIISKTDTLGNIDGCDSYPTCLQINDIAIEFGTFDIEVIDIEDLDTLPVEMEPFEFSFSDFCDNPKPPNPEFQIADTLCVGECAKTFDTFNHFAHNIEWHLTGINIDTLITDSLNFEYCFATPGEYSIQQTIWFLGCDYSFNQTIVVLNDLEAEILPNAVICGESTKLLVESNRPIQAWNWNTGDTTSNLFINHRDTFFVEITDGFCIAFDTAEIIFVLDLISEKSILKLPNDTTICVQHLPYNLIPKSDFNNNFSINGSKQIEPFFQLSSAGEYQIGIFIEGCLFEKTFNLTIDDCSTTVYLPNIFSPNNDNLNDIFFPQGNYFITQKMHIYNRWGSLIFEESGANIFWDGNIGNQKAPQGVYTFSVEVLNILTNNTEVIWGDVTLVR